YGIHLAANSSNNTISNCTASNNEGGIVLFDSNSNTITGNNVCNNSGAGIDLWHSCNNNTFTGNNVCSNDEGIDLYYSSNNTITGNTVISNRWCGILLRESSNNVITGNDFINNTEDVSSANSANFWNSTEPLTYQYNNTTFTSYIGNFWSNYKGLDADGDGLGDTHYVIDSDEDHHPLMSRFENYSFI
ncbi:hypothetical protein C4E22_07620, partial [ANME-1 cluster archaeon AG-394-G06]|nr:hypothetical protein [ANME-1 cluster archaeon AG-394-G06]